MINRKEYNGDHHQCTQARLQRVRMDGYSNVEFEERRSYGEFRKVGSEAKEKVQEAWASMDAVGVEFDVEND